MDDEVETFKVRGRRIKPSDVKLALSEGKVSIPVASPSAAPRPPATQQRSVHGRSGATPRTIRALSDLTNARPDVLQSVRKALAFCDGEKQPMAFSYRTRRVVWRVRMLVEPLNPIPLSP